MPLIVGRTFGLASYGVIYGMVNMLHMVGSATGPAITGFIYDVTGSYQIAFMLFISVYVVSIPIMLAVRSPRPIKKQIK
jgi:nitrate/nitrite transporter NarK